MTDQTESHADEGASPRVTFETTHGAFTVALEPGAAPETVENFLTTSATATMTGPSFTA